MGFLRPLGTYGIQTVASVLMLYFYSNLVGTPLALDFAPLLS